MKKQLFSAVCLLMLCIGMRAQVANYTFAKSNGVYTPITGGTALWTSAFDNQVSAAITIPSFTFDGNAYTQLYVSANGYITFGTPEAGANYFPISTGTYSGAISAMGCDLAEAASGTPEVRYATVGNEFIVQWQDARRYAVSGERISFQIRLNTATNAINIVYGGTISPGTGTAYTREVGLRGANNTFNTNTNSVMIGNVPAGTTCNWSDAVTSNANTGSMYLNTNVSIVPTSGLTFSWAPPLAAVAPVRVFGATTAITISSANMSWTAPAGATQYNVQYRIVGTCGWTNFSGNPVMTNSVSLTGLASSSIYQARVQSSDGTNNTIWSHIPDAAGSGNGYTATGTFKTLDAPCVTPTSQPTGLVFSAVYSTSVGATFSAPTPIASNYLVVRTLGAAPNTPTNGVVYTTGASAALNGTVVSVGSAATISNTGLIANTLYTYYIYAFNSTPCTGGPLYLGTSPLTGTVITCPALPTAVTSASVAANSFNLSWTAPAGGTAAPITYSVEVSANSGFTAPIAGSPFAITAPTTSLAVTGLTPVATYYYRVKADNGCNIGTTTSGNVTTSAIPTDLQTVQLTAPAVNATGCYASSIPVVIQIKNTGSAALDFSTNNATLVTSVTGPNPQTFTTTISTGTLAANATQNVTVTTTYNMSALGIYTINATGTLATPDANPSNDNMAVATRTTAAATPLPYSEDFVSGATPTGWTNTSSWLYATTHGVTNSGIYKNIYSTGTSGSSFNLLRLGTLNGAEVLTFDYRIVNFTSYPATATPNSPVWGNILVQVSTDCGNTFVTTYTIDPSNHTSSTAWANKAVPLSAFAGQSVIIKLVANWTAGDYYVDMDNFNIASCYPPTALTTTNTTAFGSDIAWTAPAVGTPANYIWEVRTSGAAGSGATGLVTTGTVTAPSTSVTAAGLAPTTTYSVYVRSNCGGSDVSNWTPVKTVTTPAACPVPTTPTVTNIIGQSAVATWTAGATETQWNIYYGASPLTVPTATTAPSATVTGTPSYTIGGLNPTTPYSVYVRADCGSGAVSAWTAVRNFTTTVSCPAPKGLVISAITPTSAVATWTVGGAETNWFVRYSAPTTTVTASGTPSYTMTSLTPSSTYSIQVRGICGVADTSAYTSQVTFVTPCLPPNITGTTPGNRCGVGTLTVGATADPGAIIRWYAAPTGGAAIATGSVLTTPSISSTTNYYVNASNMVLDSRTFGAGGSTGTAAPYDPANGGYGGMKGQYLYTAAELTAAGLDAGNITSLGFEFTTAGANLSGFVVEMGATTLTTFPTPVSILGGLSTVSPASTFTPVVGMNTINFATPYNWNGTDNIIVSISWSNNNTTNTNSTIKYDGTTNYTSQSYRQDSQTAANMATFTGATAISGGTSTFDRAQNRPMFRFTGNAPCVSARTSVAANVSTPAALTLTTPTVTCANVVATASVTSTISDYDSYIWSPVTNLYTDAAATTPYTGGTATVVYYKSATAANTVYTVNASNSVTGCANVATTTLETSIPIIKATASPTMICSGSAVNLSGTTNAIGAGTTAVGTGTTLTLGNTTEPTAFCNRYSNYRMQAVYTAAELTAAGLRAGNITSISYNIASVGSATTTPLYTVKCGTTTATAFTNFISNAAFTTVLPAMTHTHAVGVNVIPFSTPYNWDGVSNLVVEVTHDGINSTLSSQTYYTATAGNMIVYANNNSATGIPSTMRLNIVFGGQSVIQAGGTYTWQWNPGAINSNTTTVNPVNPGTTSVTTTYTVTGIDPATGCSGTATTSVVVNPIPTTPVAVNSTQCGLGIPTASVSGGTTYKWYAAPTSTTVIQSGTSQTYTTSISSTTNFYVSSFDGTCESPRATLTATVTTPDAVTATATSTSVCLGQTFTLTALNPVGVAAYNYTWTATPAAGSGMASAATGTTTAVTPGTAGNYTYLLTASDAVCTTTASVNVLVNSLPIINASVSPTVICSGSTTTLNAVTNSVATGTATVGTGSATNYIGGPYRGGSGSDDKAQWLFTAAELNAAGIYAGNITSMSFSVVTAGSVALPNFALRMGTTSSTSLTTTFDTAPTTALVGPTTYTAVTGVNTHTFAPFYWNGTSNIILQACHTATSGTSMYVTTQAISNRTIYSDISSACSLPTGTSVSYRPVIVFGAQVGTLNAGSYTWQWNPGAIGSNTATVNPVNSSTNTPTTIAYTVTGTDPATTCSNTAVVSVSVNPVPATLVAHNSTQCGFGVPTASVTGGTGIYKWYATNTSTTVLQSSTTPSYTTAINTSTTFYVSESNSTCEGPRTMVTMTVTTPDAITASVNSSSICPGTPVTLSVTKTGSANTYTYSWTGSPVAGSGIPTSVSGSTAGITPSASGLYTYTVIGTDAGCNAISTVTLAVNAVPLTPTITPSTQSVCVGSSVTLTGTSNASAFVFGTQANQNAAATGSTGYPSSYTGYYGGQRMQTLILASELSAQGFVAGSQFTDLQLPVLAKGNLAVCNDFQVKIGPSAVTSLTAFQTGLTQVISPVSYTPVVGTNTHVFSTPYTWDGTSNVVLETTFSNNMTGTVNYSVTQNNSPTPFQSTIVYRADGVTSAATATNISTSFSYNARLDLRLNAVSTTTLTWSPATGLSSTTGNTVSANPTSTTVYTVTADNGSCTSSKVFTLTVNPVPTVTVAASTSTLCSGTSASLTATGATTYAWLPAGGTSSVAVVSPAATTVYTVTGTALGCSNTQTVSLGVTATPTVAASVSPTVICAGATVSLTATGATTYSWMPNSSTSGTTTAAPTVSTIYTVSGTSAGCTNTRTVSVTVNDVPTLTITANPAGGALCTAGATATLTAAGTSAAYAWSTGANTANITVAPSATTVYTVTGINSCGTATASTTVAVATTPTIAATTSSTLICINNSVVLTANATPGVTYSWNTGASTSTISVTPTVTTTYTVTGTNACGTATATIVQNVSTCIGINEITNLGDINIYPNPASDYVSIAIPAYLTSESTIVEVTDALGKLVMKEALSHDVTTFKITKLEEGVYFFKVITNNQTIKVGKVVKH